MGYEVRVAAPDDGDGVSALLARCYPTLLAAHYDPWVLKRALPAMSRANPLLLAGGTFFVAVAVGDEDQAIVGCGGWTTGRPPGGEVEPGLGHLRHFGTDPQHLRRGVGRSIAHAAFTQARAAGIVRVECYATLGAEPFYAALGLHALETVELPMPVLGQPDTFVDFPARRMTGSVASA